jgi:NADPH:quinone reductase
MRIWRFHEFGAIENLQLDTIDVPEPGPGEALVKLQYAALNPADRYLVQGQYPRPGKPPFAVGRDGSGTVAQAAEGSCFREGDPVVVLRSDIGITRNGTLAEYVTVPEESLAPLPRGWTPEEGAAAPLVFLTAWKALVLTACLEAGQNVLITGASGGVGTAGTILAKARGSRVVALSRSAKKREQLLALGADAAVDTCADDMEEQVKSALEGARINVVLENLGGEYLQKSINLCGEDGVITVVGLLAGLTSKIVVGLLIFKQVRIEGVQVGAYTPAGSQEAWQDIVETLDTAGVRPPIDRVFPMEDVQGAFARLHEGPMGKVLVDVTA